MTILYTIFVLLCLIPLALTQQTGNHMIIAREPARNKTQNRANGMKKV